MSAEHSFLAYRDRDERGPTADGNPSAETAPARRRWLRRGEPKQGGRYVLYWLQMYRRGHSNPALAEALRRANRLELPLVVYEGLNPDYPQANARIHRFVLECARDTARALEERGVRYAFRLPRAASEKRQAAARMIRDAALVIVDDFPAFILPGVTRRALELTRESGVPVLAFDGNGVVPLREIEGRQYAARTLRPRLHRLLPRYLHAVEEPEAGVPWPPDEDGALPVRGIGPELAGASDRRLERWVRECDVDGRVLPSLRFRGGREAALRRLEEFVEEDLPRYHEAARDPGAGVTSRLSPYLHFGCVGARETALRVLEADVPGEAADAFLEQLVVRRELAYNFCLHPDEHDTLHDLPDWAGETLAEHRDDPREHVYTPEELEAAGTRTRTPASSGASASTTGRGRRPRCSGRPAP